MSLRKELEDLEACPEAIEWVGTKTLREAWVTCKKGSWMLWWLARHGIRSVPVFGACPEIGAIYRETFNMMRDSLRGGCVEAEAALADAIRAIYPKAPKRKKERGKSK
jgi:hypothetical protein